MSEEIKKILSNDNQKSNRQPVMALEEGKVVGTAQQLKELGYVSIDYGDRIVKYSHRAPGMLKVTRVSDLKARTEKMIGFESIDDVHASVKQLMSRNPALVMELPIAVGQREQRFTHLLSGEPDLSAIPVKVSKPSSNGQVQRIAELEARIERLEAALDMPWESNKEAK